MPHFPTGSAEFPLTFFTAQETLPLPWFYLNLCAGFVAGSGGFSWNKKDVQTDKSELRVAKIF